MKHGWGTSDVHFGVLVHGWRCCYESVSTRLHEDLFKLAFRSYEMKHVRDHYKDFERETQQNFTIIEKKNTTQTNSSSSYSLDLA